MRYTQVLVMLLGLLTAYGQPCVPTSTLRPSTLPDTLSAHYLAMARGALAVSLPDTASLQAAQRFEQHTRASLQRLATTGQLLDGDTLTRYVRRVHQHVAQAAQQYHTIAYIERNYTPNAYAWQSGTVVVTLGLLAQIDSEAQLAFVLAHELAHYQQQHAYLRYRQGNAQTMRRNDHELEADSLALLWLRAAGYDLHGIPNLLARLQSPQKWPTLDWPNLLTTASYRVSASAGCLYEGFSAFQLIPSSTQASLHFSQRALQERRARIQRWIQQLGDAPQPPNPTMWPCLQEHVFVELIHALYRANRYEASLYLALRRMQDTPHVPQLTLYLQEVVAHSAYALQLMAFAERQPQWLHPDVAMLLPQADYAAYCCLLNNLQRTAQMSLYYGLIKAQALARPHAEYLAYLRCQSAQMLGLAAPLAESCQAYLSQFPQGAHRLYVQALLP